MSKGGPAMSLSVSDVEKVQALYPDYRIELREGKLIVMSPSDSVSGEIAGRFITLLSNWVYTQKAGRVLDSSTGFRLPNGDLLSPDVSFVSRERLKHNPRTYAPVVPQLIVEIKSSRDRIHELEEKIALFLSQGVEVGILIDPDKHTVRVYRSDISQETTLKDGDTLSIPELFPGWEIPITSLWPVVYE
jgi:Uma2 family endonuclease